MYLSKKMFSSFTVKLQYRHLKADQITDLYFLCSRTVLLALGQMFFERVSGRSEVSLQIGFAFLTLLSYAKCFTQVGCVTQGPPT